MIPPQLILAPAAPDGWETKSSSPWWTITALPITFFTGSSQSKHQRSVENTTLPLPEASALKFPISPLWNPVSEPHAPWSSKVGFQWPPLDLPSSEEQSAFWWMWMACTPSLKPLILASNEKASFYNKAFIYNYSTVTDFARFLGWSTLQPLITAMW